MNTRHIFPAGPCARALGTPILNLAGLRVFAVASARADSFGCGGNAFTIPFVPSGNAGNANDTVAEGNPSSGVYFGAVSYNYNMSTYAISEMQIEAAVNLGAAAAYGAPKLGGGAWTGSKPAMSITWYQAAAFVNWLNTSQGYAAAYNPRPARSQC